MFNYFEGFGNTIDEAKNDSIRQARDYYPDITDGDISFQIEQSPSKLFSRQAIVMGIVDQAIVDDKTKEIALKMEQKKAKEAEQKCAIQEDKEGTEQIVIDSLYDKGRIDDLFVLAGTKIIEDQKASIGLLQRTFKIGFNRASRIMDQLAEIGVVGPEEGTKPRRILMTIEEFNDFCENEGQSLKKKEIVKREDNNNKIKEQIKEHQKKDLFRLSIMYGFSTNYRSDDIEPLEIDNMFITRPGNDSSSNIVINLVKEYPPERVKIVYFGDGEINGFDLPHFIVHSGMDPEKALSVFKWLCQEVQERKRLFVENHVKWMRDYVFVKKNNPDQQLPYLVIVIDEINELITEDFQDLLLEVLLAGPKFGISVMLMSSHALRGKKLGACKELLTIVDSKDFYLCQPLSNNNPIVEDEEEKKIDVKKKALPFGEMKGDSFLDYCVDVLSENGFENVEKTSSVGERGGVVIATRNEISHVIQCRLESGTVSSHMVKKAIGNRTIYQCHVSAILTNGVFDAEAEKMAEENQIVLWDGDDFKQMIDKVGKVGSGAYFIDLG